MKNSMKSIISVSLMILFCLSIQMSFAQGDDKIKGKKAEKMTHKEQHKVDHVHRKEIKAQVKAIKENEALTKEEKEAQIKAIRDIEMERRETHRAIKKDRRAEIETDRKARGENRRYSKKDRKGTRDEGIDKNKRSRANGSRANLRKRSNGDKINNVGERIKANNKNEGEIKNPDQLKKDRINSEKNIRGNRAKQTISQLDKVEDRYEQLLKEGKINEAQYKKRMDRLKELRAGLGSRIEK